LRSTEEEEVTSDSPSSPEHWAIATCGLDAPILEPFPEELRRAHTLPSGAFDGMMTLICPALTNTGIACTDVVPCVIFYETPPSVGRERKRERGGWS
jgi:hypothetical protein